MQCSRCNYVNPKQATFCGNCGNKIGTKSDSFDYNKHVKKVSFFFFILLGYVATIKFAISRTSYVQQLWIDGLFAILILLFYLVDMKTLNNILKLKALKKPVLIKILIFAPLAAVLVSYLADFLSQSIFDSRQIVYYKAFLDSPAPIVLSIISVGLVPALFEEIAFRGIVFNELAKITGIKSSVVISSILFTILHFSLISALWIFPIGLIFGYLRAKHRTLWYGIIGHFIYNSSIVILELLTLAGSSSSSLAGG